MLPIIAHFSANEMMLLQSHTHTYTHKDAYECRTEKMWKCQLTPDCYLANASAAASFVGIFESASGETFEEEKDSHNRTTTHTPCGQSSDGKASDPHLRACSMCFSSRASSLLRRKAAAGVGTNKSW